MSLFAEVRRALDLAQVLVDKAEAGETDDYVPIKVVVTGFAENTVWKHAKSGGWGEMRGGKRHVSLASLRAFSAEKGLSTL